VVPVLMYGSECWSLLKEYDRKILSAEMSRQKRIIGKTRKERI